jgi:hypothetical protein
MGTPASIMHPASESAPLRLASRAATRPLSRGSCPWWTALHQGIGAVIMTSPPWWTAQPARHQQHSSSTAARHQQHSSSTAARHQQHSSSTAARHQQHSSSTAAAQLPAIKASCHAMMHACSPRLPSLVCLYGLWYGLMHAWSPPAVRERSEGRIMHASWVHQHASMMHASWHPCCLVMHASIMAPSSCIYDACCLVASIMALVAVPSLSLHHAPSWTK